LDNNNLSGDIPYFSFPNLQSFSMKNNKLTGALPDYNFPKLRGLNVDNNLLVDLPALLSINQTTLLSVRNNKLTFEDLETNIMIPKFIYDGQDTILPLDVTSYPMHTKLQVLAAGKYNTYQWHKDTSDIAGATDSVYDATEDGDYSCIVNNTLITKLTLYSETRTIVIDTTDTTTVNEYKYNFTVYENSPNPFSNSTTIKFQLNASDFVKIAIFNTLGLKQSILFEGYLSG
ncbi:MAG: hypothetical protein ABSG15_06825, partial [FCB group bacterium]